MPKFLYKAKNNKGQIVTGTVNSANEIEAEKILIKHNLVATDIVLDRPIPFFSNLFTPKISIKQKAVVSRQLATMLSAGLALTKAISILAKQARTDHERAIFLGIYKDLEEGYAFSSAIAKYPEAFDKVFVSVVRSGESTGKLDVVLNDLADQLEGDSNFISKIKSSMSYPIFIMIVLLVAGVFMLTFVIPKLKTMFDQAQQKLPLMTRILLSMSDFMQHFWWVALVIVFLIFVFIRYWVKTDAGILFVDTMKLKLPIFKGIFEGMSMYRFTRIMSMLVGAGVPLLDALRIGGSVIDNSVYEASIKKVAEQVEKGVPLSSQLLRDPLFPPLVGQMAAVGEETGEVDKILSKVADYYKQSTNDMTSAISSLVEPFVLIVVGLAVAFMVFAIYLPIYQINSTVS